MWADNPWPSPFALGEHFGEAPKNSYSCQAAWVVTGQGLGLQILGCGMVSNSWDEGHDRVFREEEEEGQLYFLSLPPMLSPL